MEKLDIRRIIRQIATLLAGGAIVIVSSGSHGFAASAPSVRITPEAFAEMRAIVDSFYSFMNANWSGSDEPYAKIRRDIDSALSRGVSPEEVLQHTETEYPQSNVPISVFARGYAGLMTDYKFDAGTKDDVNACSLMRQTGNEIFYRSKLFPHTYNFVRLAFLLDGDVGTGKLNTVGEKLLKKAPYDQEVSFVLTIVLLESGEQPDIQMAIKLANERVAEHPNEFRSYSVLARVQLAQYNATHDVIYAKMAISSYHHATSLAQSFPGDRAYYATRIAAIEKLITK